MAITTTSDLNGLYNQIYERALFVLRESNLMVQLVSNYSANNFYTRNITTRPQLTVETTSEGVDYANAQSFGKTLVGSLTPQERIAQVVITDIEIMNDPDSTVGDASQELGASMAAKVDTDLTDVFNSFATDKGTGAGNSANLASIASAVSILRNRFANRDGLINIVLHPYHWHDIWVLLGQPVNTASFLGDAANAALRDYFVGNMLGVRWFTSNNVPVTGNNAVSGIFTQSAIAFDSRISPYMENERDASLRATEMNFVSAYAVGLGKRPTLGIKYTADATTP